MQDFKRELKLTIENTEHLYNLALSVNDFDWLSDQVDALQVQAVQQIKENGAGSKVPHLHTDFDVKEVGEHVAGIAKDLQLEYSK